jgi:hypothetical protein
MVAVSTNRSFPKVKMLEMCSEISKKVAGAEQKIAPMQAAPAMVGCMSAYGQPMPMAHQAPPTGAKFDPMTGQPIPKFDPMTGVQNWDA